MIEDFDFSVLVEPALTWYQEKKRILPWRQNRDPYAIWVSEIMLQQTRVEAVIPYYHRFMKELPDIADLAGCPEDQLLKLWEGLGYYNRVRNMQKAAQVILEEYDGRMPASYEQIVQLPGIGPYTAGAIASIAFGEKVPAVDGNVLRIICRVCEDDSDILKETTKKRVASALQEVMPDSPGEFNQALMEIGALLCIPNGTPRCEVCPWEAVCRSGRSGRYSEIPVKKKAKQRRIEQRTILIIRDGEKILLHKRPNRGLLAGLYEPPNLEGVWSEEEVLEFVRRQQLDPLHIQVLPEAKHIFSHVEWDMIGFMIRVSDVESFQEEGEAFARQHSSEPGKDYLLVEVEKVEREYAIPTAFEAYVRYVNISL